MQIIGEKHFVLLPPLFYPCVDERALSPASYVRTSRTPSSTASELEVQREEGGDVVWATWDPDSLKEEREGYAKLARPMRVTLSKGDMLYLPRLWYHKVSQSCDEEGICCAVNYWFVSSFSFSSVYERESYAGGKETFAERNVLTQKPTGTIWSLEGVSTRLPSS